MEKARQHSAVGRRLTRTVQIALSFSVYASLIAGVILALIDAPYGYWAFLLFMGCLGLRAILNVISGLRANVVYSNYGIEVDRRIRPADYVWVFGLQTIIASVFALLCIFILVYRVLL